MKQPFMKKFPVFEWDYRERDLDVTIYSYFEKTPNEWDDEEEVEDSCEEDDLSHPRLTRDSNEKNAITKKSLEDITLQSILDNLPEGITASDVKISLNIDCSDMAVEGAEIIFYYKKHLPARPELFKQERAIYDAEYAEYEKKQAAYEEWQKQQQVKELEEKLARLKK